MGFFLNFYGNCIGVNIRNLFVLFFIIFCSKIALADQKSYGPRFEAGLGGSGSRLQSRPDWSSKVYVSGIATFSFRIAYGLSLQIGKDLHYGKIPQKEWFNYGKHYQINSEKGTYRDASWVGARYDIPMKILTKDLHGIHTVYFSGGLTWDEYNLQSKEQLYYSTPNGWELGEKPQERDSVRSFKTSDLKGYYVAMAARWRINTEYTEENSWIGAYGIDVGLRYTRYYDCRTKYDNIMEAKSNFNYFQIFIIGFLKMRLFY